MKTCWKEEKIRVARVWSPILSQFPEKNSWADTMQMNCWCIMKKCAWLALQSRVCTVRSLFFFVLFSPKKTLFLGFSARSTEFFLGFFGVFFGVLQFFRFRGFFWGFGAKRRKTPKTVFLRGFWRFLEFFLELFFGVLQFFEISRFFLEFFLRFLFLWNLEVFLGVLPKP